MKSDRIGRNAPHATYRYPCCRPWACLHSRHAGEPTSPVAASRLSLGRCLDWSVHARLCCRPSVGAPTRRARCNPVDVWHRLTFLLARSTFGTDDRGSRGLRSNGSGDIAWIHRHAGDRMADRSWPRVWIGPVSGEHGCGSPSFAGEATTGNRWRAYCRRMARRRGRRHDPRARIVASLRRCPRRYCEPGGTRKQRNANIF